MSQKNLINHIKLILSIFFLTSNSSCAGNANSDFVVTSITENVYSIVSPSIGLPTPENKGWNSNIHFIVTEKGVLLFDTGSSESIGNKIKQAIKTVTDHPVRWIINSHSHADHWLGNVAFKDMAVEIIASNHTFKTMKKYGEEDVKFYSKVTNGAIGDTQLLYPNKLLSQGGEYNFGGVNVELFFSNDAHSPGDILLWLPKQKIIIGGDVLSSDYMPMITGHGNVTNLINTLEFVVKLDPIIVLTGHGKATKVESVIRDIDLLSSVWKQVKSDIKKGKKSNETLRDIITKLEHKYGPLYIDFKTEIERHIKLMYKLQE